MNKTIDAASCELLALTSKMAVLGMTDDEGCPHLTFLSSLQGLGEDKLIFGQFSVGESKKFLLRRPDCVFLAMTADLKWLRGSARFTHTAKTGPEFDMYNNKPLFRYNAYFGVNTVWYFDLLGISGVRKLPLPQIGSGALLTRALSPFAAKNEKQALSPLSKALFAGIDNPKILCWEGEEGPAVVPVVQAAHAGGDRVVFFGRPFGGELKALTPGARVAVMAMNMGMQSVLVKGVYAGKTAGLHTVDIERVYNSMPPAAGYVYPRAGRPEEVAEF